MSETSRIQYIIRDGVLKFSGQIRYQDRDLDGLVEIEEVAARPSRAPGVRRSRPPAASR